MKNNNLFCLKDNLVLFEIKKDIVFIIAFLCSIKNIVFYNVKNNKLFDIVFL